MPKTIPIIYLSIIALSLSTYAQQRQSVQTTTSTAPGVTLSATPSSGPAPLTVNFQATCPTCVAWVWDFGDNSAPPPHSLAQIHTYQQAGTFYVIFAGTDKNGAPLTAQATINVAGAEDNMYCGPNNNWTGEATDGPSALPKACFNTAIANTPAPGPTVSVAPGQNLMALYNAAVCGTVFKLAHGATWNAPFNWANKNCDNKHWIWFMTDGTVPPPGTRAGAANATQMAKFGFKSAGMTGGDHLRFIGIEFAKQSGYTGIVFQFYNMTGANNIIIDRSYAHGNPGEETQHGFQTGNAQYWAVIDSSLQEFHCIAKIGTCIDAQAISGGTGPTGIGQSGPGKAVNNLIEASGEGILFGGAVADAAGPHDVEIRRNWINKPMSWNPADPSFNHDPHYNYITKNFFELKNGIRFLFEGNVMTNNWGGYTQAGFSILLTPKNQAGTANGKPINLCPNCAVQDTVIRYNSVSTAGGFLVIGSGANDNGAYCMGQQRVSVHDVVIDNLGYSTCFGCTSMMMELGSGYNATNPPPAGGVLMNALVTNLTLIATGNRAGNPGAASTASGYMEIGSVPPNNPTGTPQATNIGMTNSIFSVMANGLTSTGGGTNNCMVTVMPKPGIPKNSWPWCFTGTSPLTGNVLVNSPTPYIGKGGVNDWPAGTALEPNFNSMFVNFNGGVNGDYHLAPNSPYAGKGADVDKVNQYTAGVR